MCGQHNVRAPPETTQDRTQTNKTHPSSRTEIKIPDLAGNRTRAAGLEGRDSTDHATATDQFNFSASKNTTMRKNAKKICRYRISGQITVIKVIDNDFI